MSLNYGERSVESGDAFPLDSGFRRNDEEGDRNDGGG